MNKLTNYQKDVVFNQIMRKHTLSIRLTSTKGLPKLPTIYTRRKLGYRLNYKLRFDSLYLDNNNRIYGYLYFRGCFRTQKVYLAQLLPVIDDDSKLAVLQLLTEYEEALANTVKYPSLDYIVSFQDNKVKVGCQNVSPKDAVALAKAILNKYGDTK